MVVSFVLEMQISVTANVIGFGLIRFQRGAGQICTWSRGEGENQQSGAVSEVSGLRARDDTPGGGLHPARAPLGVESSSSPLFQRSLK